MSASELLMTNGATPATPASGKTKVFANTSKNLSQLNDAGTAIDLVNGKATGQSTPSNPTGSTSATGVMMGLAGTITPSSSGKVLFMISGSISNNTNADGASAQLFFGTGSAPANQAAPSGTGIGGVVTLTNCTTGNNKFPFAIQAIVTGLTLGTAYWFDISLIRITGGTAAITDISLSATEL